MDRSFEGSEHASLPVERLTTNPSTKPPAAAYSAENPSSIGTIGSNPAIRPIDDNGDPPDDPKQDRTDQASLGTRESRR